MARDYWQSGEIIRFWKPDGTAVNQPMPIRLIIGVAIGVIVFITSMNFWQPPAWEEIKWLVLSRLRKHKPGQAGS